MQGRLNKVRLSMAELMEMLFDGAHAIRVGDVSYVVLDEADKMLSMGFDPQLKRLRKLLLPRRSAGETSEPDSAPITPPPAVASRKRPQVMRHHCPASARCINRETSHVRTAIAARLELHKRAGAGRPLRQDRHNVDPLVCQLFWGVGSRNHW